MRIPNRIIEHPIETAVASLLLLGLLFGSADFRVNSTSPEKAEAGAVQKL